VASAQGSVDQLQGSVGVHLGGATFGFLEEDRRSFERGAGRDSSGRQHTPGIVRASTQAFAALLESGETATASDAGDGIRGPRFAGKIARAIRVYETNAAIISGNINRLGTSVSLVL